MSHKKHKPQLSNLTLWVMTITTGFVVANLYYNQPLLGDIANTFHISNGKAGQVSMLTQVGYAVGMFFIIPLGDMLKRKRLMLIDFIFIIVSLLLAAFSPNINLLLIASFLIGATSVIPQLLLPMTAHLANPEERGKKIGFVMSGLLIGILLSRTISGLVGAQFGWRAMFYIAAGIMVIIWALIYFLLPEIEPDYTGDYKSLMKSLIHLFQEQPLLRLASLRGALCFATFSAFWTTLVFLLKQPQFHSGSAMAGAFGLVGAFGAIAAGLMGRLSDKMNAYKLTMFTMVLILVSFIIFYYSSNSLLGLVAGVIILDMGVQATHISNQTIIFALDAEARNRINTIYMVSYFIGGSAGTYLASQLWSTYQWNGVCAIGIILSLTAIIVHLASRRMIQNERSRARS